MPFTHPLDKVEGSQVLDQCFRFLGCFARAVGLLPITINQSTGFAECRLLSTNFLKTLIYTGLYIGLSLFYLPLYLESTAGLKADGFTVYISEHLFFGGQVVAVVASIILIPFMAFNMTRIWNQFVPVVEFCVDQGYKDDFKGPYRRSRISMIVFSILVVIYGIICWRTLSAGLELQKISGSLLYWAHAIGFIVYFLINCCHFTHGFVMLFFVFTLRISFIMLKQAIDKDMLAVEVCKGIVRPKTQEHFKMYKSLASVTYLLGNTFGLYLVVELVVMMMSILMNAFTMLSGFEQRDALSTTLSFVGYLGWIIMLTEGGERFRMEAYHCSQSLKESVYLHSKDTPMLHKVSHLEVPKFSAMGYFSVDRRLAITVGATFATYLVVIIQFKLNALTNNCKYTE